MQVGPYARERPEFRDTLLYRAVHHVLKTSSYEPLLKRKKWGNANSGAAPKTPNNTAAHSAGGGAPSGMSEAGPGLSSPHSSYPPSSKMLK